MAKHRVVIIGSAGRLADATKVNKECFEWVVEEAAREIEKAGYLWSELELCSGGAAFVDHAAVVLAQQKDCELRICLPSLWDSNKKQFADTGKRNWRENPGGTSNYYHREFSKKVGRDSLLELHEAVQKAKISIEDGFHARNSVVAEKADLLLAFTFGDKDASSPSSSGTLGTWKKSKASVKIHKSIF